MSVTLKGARLFLVLSCILLIMLAAFFWFRFWLPGERLSGAAEEKAGQVQTVSIIRQPDSVDERVRDHVPKAALSAEARLYANGADSGSDNAFDWQIPAWLPPPPVPADNPMSEAKVSLGRHLFYDHRLSRDNSVACVSCHVQSLGFADGKALSVGVGGSMTKRNAMGLANVGYSPVLTWANPHMKSLERQSLIPMFSEEPVEMGLAGQEQLLFDRLQNEPLYRELFAQAFPEWEGRVDLATVTRALAAFQRTLISVGSPYDRYKYGGDESAMDEAALRGEALFYSEKAECYHCHQGFNFTDTLQTANSGFAEVAFYNTGLYNLNDEGAYPPGGMGLYTFTNKASDMGKFRTQSLRNVGVTAPYFHDGSAATLEEVIDHYAAGGRTLQGTLAGDGSANTFKDPLVVGFDTSDTVREDLVAFLHSLTDTEFLANPRFSDPWPEDHPARGVATLTPGIHDSTTTEDSNP